MQTPFPGIDPWLENPAIWQGFHTRLIVEIADTLQPLLDPRYLASVEERVYLEAGDPRRPDVAVETAAPVSSGRPTRTAVAVVEPRSPGVAVVTVDPAPRRQRRIEILDTRDAMRLVTAIEVVSPTNRIAGPGRKSYLKKQAELLRRECHLVEIDPIRRGRHLVAVPEATARRDDPDFDYLACVSRWPNRQRFELYRMRLRDRPAPISIPLVAPDADVLLDLKAALDTVWSKGRYHWKVAYDKPCVPRLPPEDQAWATERWREWRAANASLFADAVD